MPGNNDGGNVVHPAEAYLRNYDKSRDQIQSEISKQELLAKHDPDAAVRTQAQIDGTALVAELGKMQAEHVAFLVKIMTEGVGSGPAQTVVEETVKLNKALAQVVIDNNRASVFIGLIQQWLNGAIAVFNGKVPAPPPSPAPALSSGIN